MTHSLFLLTFFLSHLHSLLLSIVLPISVLLSRRLAVSPSRFRCFFLSFMPTSCLCSYLLSSLVTYNSSYSLAFFFLSCLDFFVPSFFPRYLLSYWFLLLFPLLNFFSSHFLSFFLSFLSSFCITFFHAEFLLLHFLLNFCHSTLPARLLSFFLSFFSSYHLPFTLTTLTTLENRNTGCFIDTSSAE